MVYISHRGNINGCNPKNENKPSYILEALNQGYDVEIDVWFNGINFMLGHDFPKYPVFESFLMNNHLWCHAKNIHAIKKLVDLSIHCFFHNVDDCVLTSRNKIWVYPNKPLVEGSIAVLPERANYSFEDLKCCGGICSDVIQKYKKTLNIYSFNNEKT